MVKFYLRDPKAEAETPIYVSVYYQGRNIKVSVGERIHPNNWNQKKGRARVSMHPVHRDTLNSRIASIESRTDKKVQTLLSQDGGPTVDHLRTVMREIVKPQHKPKEDLIGFIDRFILAITPQRSPETIKAYRNSKMHLENFITQMHLRPQLRDVDISFYDQFVDYLSGKNYSQNTIGKQVKQLKVFVNEAREQGIRVSEEIRSRRFKVISEDRDHVYLTLQELETVWKKDLSDSPRLDRTRDLFLVGCFTGLRFSDLSELRLENIFQKEFFKIRTRKNDQLIIIPIHPRIKEIMNKYDWNLPPAISNQKMNEYITEVMKLAEINDPVITTITKGGKREDNVHSKYDLISCHTARRSFATNAFIAGIPSISIMKITGHRTEKAFMRYIHISQEENASQLAGHGFFNGSLK